MQEKRQMSFRTALAIIIIMMVTILISSIGLKSGIVTTFFLIVIEMLVISIILKQPLGEVEKAGFSYTVKAMPAFFILIAVGAMVAMWISAGVVPTLIYAGLKTISPKIVLAMSMLLTSLAALATGTSYGSMATVGVTMMGIGASMNIPLPMVAGAVICGAFFGDTMSPCSDVTNVTSAATQTPLIKTIKHMFVGQLPAYILTLIIFSVLGLRYANTEIDPTEINAITETLRTNFHIGPVAVIPAVVVIGMLICKIPTLLSLSGGIISSALVAVFYQGIPFNQLVTYMQKGFSIDTGFAAVDTILNRGGIASMYDVAVLIILAMFISGVMSHLGVMDAFVGLIIQKVKGRVSLVLITMVLTYFLSATVGSYSLAAVVTASFMLPLYKKMAFRSENLARVIICCSAYIGVLIPWNGHAVYAASTLGVEPAAYFPYCFLVFLNPIMIVILAVTGLSMTKYSKQELDEIQATDQV